jgi:hypothetical protein
VIGWVHVPFFANLLNELREQFLAIVRLLEVTTHIQCAPTLNLFLAFVCFGMVSLLLYIIARGFFVYLWTWTGFVKKDITAAAFLELKMLCKSTRKKKKKKIELFNEKQKKELQDLDLAEESRSGGEENVSDSEDATRKEAQRRKSVTTAICNRFVQLERDWDSLDENSAVNSKASRILLILGLGSLLLYVTTFVVLLLEFSAVILSFRLLLAFELAAEGMMKFWLLSTAGATYNLFLVKKQNSC